MKLIIDNFKHPDFCLSGRELAVAGAFLRIPVLYGIQSDLFSDWRRNPSDTVRETVKELEEKRLLSCRIDGKVIMVPELHCCLMCMGFPERILWICTNRKTGICGKYIFYCTSKKCVLVKTDLSEKYDLFLITESKELEEILGQMNNSGKGGAERNIRERISFAQIEKVKQRSESFDLRGAEEILRDCLHDKGDETVGMVQDIISGNFSFGFCKYWIWHKKKIVNTGSICFGEWDDRVFRMKTEESYLSLEESSVKDIREKIREMIVGGMQRDGDSDCNDD